MDLRFVVSFRVVARAVACLMDRFIGRVVGGYQVEALIGWGSCAKVYRGRGGEKVVAIKIISKRKAMQLGYGGGLSVLNHLYNECDILQRLCHPNIVKLYDWFESSKRIYLFLELAHDGDVLTRLNNASEPLPEITLRHWFAQVVDALSYAHSMGVAHKDIKPDNLLLDGDRVLVADWGFSHTFIRSQPCNIWAGTMQYWSPEVAGRLPHEGPEADCWSLGVTLYAVTCRALPFDCTASTYEHDMRVGNYTLPPFASLQLCSIIRGLLAGDVEARMTLDDVKVHGFYTGRPHRTKSEEVNNEIVSAFRKEHTTRRAQSATFIAVSQPKLKRVNDHHQQESPIDSHCSDEPPDPCTTIVVCESPLVESKPVIDTSLTIVTTTALQNSCKATPQTTTAATTSTTKPRSRRFSPLCLLTTLVRGVASFVSIR